MRASHWRFVVRRLSAASCVSAGDGDAEARLVLCFGGWLLRWRHLHCAKNAHLGLT